MSGNQPFEDDMMITYAGDDDFNSAGDQPYSFPVLKGIVTASDLGLLYFLLSLMIDQYKDATYRDPGDACLPIACSLARKMPTQVVGASASEGLSIYMETSAHPHA